VSVRTVAAAGTSFLVREEGAGDGTPVLLLHGVPETSSCWKALAPQLAVGRRVLAPDLPGLGGSTYSGPYDVASLVQQLVALVEQEGAGRPVDVVGHDWGGSLALGLAGTRPDLVRRLAVLNAPYRSVPLHRALHIPFLALPVLPELLFRLGGRKVVRAAFSLAWRASRPIDGESLAEYEAAYSQPASVRAMLGYYREAARPRIAAAVRRTGGPTGSPRVAAERMLVLWGAADPVLPISVGEAAVRDLGPECVMVTVPGAGHFVVEEAPDVVAEQLADFLGDRPAAASVAPPEGPAVHRVSEPDPASADLGEAPSVGLVPVGGTPAEQAAAAPAKPTAKKAAATRAPAKKVPAKQAATTPARRPSGPSPEAPPSPGTA
jgi:pimeloyl-ACP methyl ester carboxylesterase